MGDSVRLSDVKVGVFVLVALGILAAGSLWIAGFTFVGRRHLTYVVAMKDSAGIQAGDRVRFAGVAVGRVQETRLRPDDEWPVEMTVAVRPEIPVKTDSAARVVSSGLMGAAFLLIEPGSPDAPLLPEGGEIRTRGGPGFEDVLGHVDEISTRVIVLLDETSETLRQVSSEVLPVLDGTGRLLSRDNIESVEGILANLDEITGEAAPRIGELLEHLDAVSRELEGTVDGMPELMERISSLVDDLQAAFGPEGARLAGVLESAEGSLASADEALGLIRDRRAELEWMIDDLRDAVSNLKAFSQQVKERPFSLVRIKPEPDRRPGDGARP